MQCDQCPKPALFLYGDGEAAVPLCLECGLKMQSIIDRRLEDCERMVNYSAQQIEMAVGLPGLVPRFPERKRPTVINAGGVSMTSLNIDRSTIGLVNMGQIGTVDSAVGVLSTSGEVDAAKAFKQFTEALVRIQEVDAALKNQLIEMISLLAAEATVPPPQRRNSAMRALVAEIATVCSGVGGLATLYAQFGPPIAALFR